MRAGLLLLLLPAPIVNSSAPLCGSVACEDASSYWRVAGDCELSDLGRCVTDGPGDYGNSERCTAFAVDDFYIFTALFDLEPTHDWVSIGGREYTSNVGGRGPNGVHMNPGDRLEWYSDSSIRDRGWKICAEYADWEGGSSFTSFFRNFDFPFWIVPFPFLIFAVLIHMCTAGSPSPDLWVLPLAPTCRFALLSQSSWDRDTPPQAPSKTADDRDGTPAASACGRRPTPTTAAGAGRRHPCRAFCRRDGCGGQPCRSVRQAIRGAFCELSSHPAPDSITRSAPSSHTALLPPVLLTRISSDLALLRSCSHASRQTSLSPPGPARASPDLSPHW